MCIGTLWFDTALFLAKKELNIDRCLLNFIFLNWLYVITVYNIKLLSFNLSQTIQLNYSVQRERDEVSNFTCLTNLRSIYVTEHLNMGESFANVADTQNLDPYNSHQTNLLNKVIARNREHNRSLELLPRIWLSCATALLMLEQRPDIF